MKCEQILEKGDLQAIFANVELLLGVNRKLLSDLQTKDVGTAFLKMVISIELLIVF